jgi:hypothetical protein
MRGLVRRGGMGENCIQTFIKKTQRSEGNDVLKWIKEKEMCESVKRNFLNQNRVHWRPFFFNMAMNLGGTRLWEIYVSTDHLVQGVATTRLSHVTGPASAMSLYKYGINIILIK